jgi:hypothetical protein
MPTRRLAVVGIAVLAVFASLGVAFALLRTPDDAAPPDVASTAEPETDASPTISTPRDDRGSPAAPRRSRPSPAPPDAPLSLRPGTIPRRAPTSREADLAPQTLSVNRRADQSSSSSTRSAARI